MTDMRIMQASPARPRQQVRRRLLGSGAMAACIAALLLNPSHAQAQSATPTAFQGTPVVRTPGSATIVRTPTLDTITLNARQAIIDWTPYDRTGTGTIDFLPGGLGALFTGAQDFTVLNRIIPVDGNDISIARLIALNGTISSLVNDSSGGSVWFYSPGGILVGQNAVINVGSLVLTNRDIDTTDGLFGANGEIRFRDPKLAGSNTAGVEIAAGARINALVDGVPGGSYIALVAPRVVQAGRVRADGSIALVAAESADVTINQGLFDINVTVGTGDANGIVHTGETGGPSEISATNASRVYMVAVPKNQALTMLLSGVVGFETPTSATVDSNGAIILSAGRNIVRGEVADAAPTGANGTAGLTISGGVFRNDVIGAATHDILVQPDGLCISSCGTSGPGVIQFNGGVELVGDRSVTVKVDGVQAINVADNMRLTSANGGVGGRVDISANNGGSLYVAGGLNVSADGIGEDGDAQGVGRGGQINLSTANGATIHANSLSLSANGQGALTGTGAGGTGTGGTVAIAIGAGSSLLTNDLTASANGLGSSSATTGGAGTGGTIRLTTDAAFSPSSITLTANGNGGVGRTVSGNGTGGSVTMDVLAGGVVTTQAVTLNANGIGGSSGPFSNFSTLVGGNGIGGRVALNYGGADPTGSNLGLTTLRADGVGGTGFDSNATQPVVGGNGTGGTATFTQSNGRTDFSSLYVSAGALGGQASGVGSVGGNATGGTSQLLMNGVSSLNTTGDITITSLARGGQAEARAGNGTGGTAEAFVTPEAQLNVGNLLIGADGYGGGSDVITQSSLANTAIGGAGQGGVARLNNSGRISAYQAVVSADGHGGDGFGVSNAPLGGNGRGGQAIVEMSGGTIITEYLALYANGLSGAGGNSNGTAGFANGGTATLAVSGGTVTVNQFASIFANAAVDLSAANIDSGALGGSVNLIVSNGAAFNVVRQLDLQANAGGGRYSSTGRSGADFRGGTITMAAQNGGAIGFESLRAEAIGRATNVTGAAGAGYGGTVSISAIGLGSITASDPNAVGNGFNVLADGYGGDGGSGGNGFGGNIAMLVDGGSIVIPVNATLSADGVAGFIDSFVTARPTGQGGSINITLRAGDTSVMNFQQLLAHATGSGSYYDGMSAGRGGTISFRNEGGQFTGDSVGLYAHGSGSYGGDGFGGAIDFQQIGGRTQIGTLQAGAGGFGGYNYVGNGGQGTGGTVNVAVTGGTLAGSFAGFDASGYGGSGSFGGSNGEGDILSAGNGGEGIGGNVNLTLDGGTINLGFLGLTAGASGGSGGNFNQANGADGLPGRGGNAVGGQVIADLISGNMSGTTLSLVSSARAGDGGRFSGIFAARVGGASLVSGEPGDFASAVPQAGPSDPTGGDAVGGYSSLRLHSTVGGTYQIDSSATAGEGGSGFAGFAGGNATGGLSELVVDNADVGTIDVTFYSYGNGGRGGRGLNGRGGDGGTGIGGRASVVVTGAEGHITIGDGGFFIEGLGGNGGNGGQTDSLPNGFDGGNGGQGIGGTIEFVAQSGGNITLASANGEGVMLRARGFGGNGGTGSNNNFGDPAVATFGGNGGQGGSGMGGSILLTARGGSIDVEPFADFTADASGNGGYGGYGGAGTYVETYDPITDTFSGNGGSGNSYSQSTATQGGLIRISALNDGTSDGVVTLPNTYLDVSGLYAGRIELIDEVAGPGISMNFLDARANGYQTGNSGFAVKSVNGAIRVNLSATFIANSPTPLDSGTFDIDAAGTGGLSVGGNLNVAASSINGTHGGNPTSGQVNATIAAGRINLNAARAINFAPSTLMQSVNGIDLTALTSPTGTIAFGALVSGGNGMDIAATGSIVGGDIRSQGTVYAVSGTSMSINSINAFRVELEAGTSLRVGSLTTTGSYADLLAGGAISVDTADVATFLAFESTGSSVTIGTAASNDAADVTAAGDIIIGSLLTRGVPATSSSPGGGTSIALTAGGTVRLGSLDASANIDINAAAVTGVESNLRAVNAITVVTTGDMVLGSATANSVSFNAGGLINFGSVSATSSADLRSVGTLTGGALFVSSGDATAISTGSDVVLDHGDIGGAFTVDAFRDALLGTFESDLDTNVRAGRNARATSLTTVGIGSSGTSTSVPAGQANGSGSSNIIFNVVGDLNLGALDSAGDISITAATLSGAASTLRSAGATTINTTGNAVFGTLDAQTAAITNGGTLNFNRSTTSGLTSINAAAVTGNALTSLNAGLTVTAGAGGIRIGSVSAETGVNLLSAGLIDVGLLNVSDGDAVLNAQGDVILGDGSVNYLLDVTGANARIGTMSAGTANVVSGGLLTVTKLTTTGAFASQLPNPGDINLRAAGAVNLGELNAARAIIIRAGTLTGPTSILRSVGATTITTDGLATFGTLNAQTALISAGGPLTFNSVSTSGNASLSATGAVTGTLVQTTAPGSIINISGVRIDISGVTGSGDVRLSATGGNLTIGTLIAAGLVSATGQSVTIGGSGNLDFSTLVASAGNASVTSAGGTLRVRSGTASGNLSLTTTGGGLTADALSAAGITLTSNSTVALTGTVTATGTLAINSVRATSIDAVATGQTVRISSGDIIIGANGRVGTAGSTSLVDLTNSDGSSRTFIGGTDVTSGYSLSAAELLRLFGGNIAIHAPRAQTQGGGSLGSTRPPDVVIGAFTLNGGAATNGNIGSGGAFSIDTPGSARVTGAVQFNGMGSGNQFRLTARQAIEVILGQGSIRLNGANGLSGILNLQSDDIVVATSAAISDIAAMTTTADINTRLSQNDGIVSDDGALAAGMMQFDVINGLYIQNSGTTDSFADRRGFTANAVNISTESSSTRIVINGRVADDTGVYRTGLDAIELVSVNGVAGDLLTAATGGFDPGSTINGCVIIQASTCSVGFVLPPVQDVVNEVIDGPGGDLDGGLTGDSNIANVLVDIREVAPLPNEPLVDDPVTGTGNDDLWTAPEQ